MVRGTTDLDKAIELRAYGLQTFGNADGVVKDRILGIDFVGFLDASQEGADYLRRVCSPRMACCCIADWCQLGVTHALNTYISASYLLDSLEYFLLMGLGTALLERLGLVRSYPRRVGSIHIVRRHRGQQSGNARVKLRRVGCEAGKSKPGKHGRLAPLAFSFEPPYLSVCLVATS